MNDRCIFNDKYPRGILESELAAIELREAYEASSPEAKAAFDSLSDLIARVEEESFGKSIYDRTIS